jgi:hypothetical protein
MTADVRTAAWRRTLGENAYGDLAADFIRFRDDTHDDAVGSVVRDVSLAGAGTAADLRATLGSLEVGTLGLFAMRRTLVARRIASTSAAGDALAAFALEPTIAAVPWESWLKAALFIVRSLGGDVDAAAARFADLADERAVQRLSVAVDALDRVSSLAQCHLAEVATSHGTGFVETLIFRDSAPPGWLGTAPRLGDRFVGYEPATNLAQVATTLADALDATGDVVTGPLGPDQLAASPFGLTLHGSYVATTGCLSFVAETIHDAASFSVFAAEVPAETDVDELVAGASGEGQVVVADDRRVVLAMAQPSFDDDAAPIDLAPVAALARSALSATAPRWRPGSSPT